MERKISKKSKRRLMTFGIISIFAIGYFFFTLTGYIYNYVCLKNEENNLKSELLALQDEKKSLKVEIQKLNDPKYVIRYAKEKFLYSSENEFVIKINKSDNIVSENKNNNNVVHIVIISIILFILILLFIRLNFLKLLKSKKI